MYKKIFSLFLSFAAVTGVQQAAHAADTYPTRPLRIVVELYDLSGDPHEIHNRFADPDYAAIRAELLWQLSTEMTRLSSNLPLATNMA